MKTKVVVRNLPFQFLEVDFEVHFKKYLPDIEMFYLKKGYIFGTNVFPTIAFLNFKNEEKLFEFSKEFHDFDFIFKKKIYKLNVEYSPYQKMIQLNKGFDDPIINTIEKDEDFIKFEEELKKPTIRDLSAELKLEKKEEEERKMIEEGETNQVYEITPLVDELLKRKNFMNKKPNHKKKSKPKKKPKPEE
jgi:hypothetical protein